jgi:enoyl-CoA hydratase
MTDSASDPEVLIERRGSAGLITLNRPQALNALTLAMVRSMRRVLDDWITDPGVTRVVVAACCTTSARPAGTTRRCSSGARNMSSTR